MTDSIPSAAYRRLQRLTDPDSQSEMSSEEYRSRYGQTANDLVPRLHSSQVDTESPAKTAFGEWLAVASPYPVVAEYRFLTDRMFRADWSIPPLKLIFEYDGIADHGTRKGSERDAEKSNLAQLAGWLFIRVNARSLNDGSGYTMAETAINCRLRGAA